MKSEHVAEWEKTKDDRIEIRLTVSRYLLRDCAKDQYLLDGLERSLGRDAIAIALRVLKATDG